MHSIFHVKAERFTAIASVKLTELSEHCSLKNCQQVPQEHCHQLYYQGNHSDHSLLLVSQWLGSAGHAQQ